MSNPVTRAARRFWGGSTITVQEGLGGHANSLGIIRLALALLVIVSHAFPLGGWGDDPFLRFSAGQENLGDLAVLGFFAISGYLIAKSGMKGDVVTFLWHRFLRIFPAFWVVLLVSALVVGPLTWLAYGRGFGSYWTAHGGPVTYLTGNAFLRIHHYGIADLYLDTPYGRMVDASVLNGSLWTLRHEFFCYLIIAGLVLLTVMSRPAVARVVIPLITVGFLAIRLGVEFGHNLGNGLPFINIQDRTRLAFAFMIGSCLAVYARRVRFDDRLAALAFVVGLVTIRYGWFWVFGIPAFSYLVLWLAYRLPRSWRWIGARNDYSYGVYLYGFLVEQVLAGLGVYRWGYVPYVVLSIIPTAGLAWLSWHGVEKHAMALKDRGPGRGVAALRARLSRVRTAAP